MLNPPLCFSSHLRRTTNNNNIRYEELSFFLVCPCTTLPRHGEALWCRCCEPSVSSAGFFVFLRKAPLRNLRSVTLPRGAIVGGRGEGGGAGGSGPRPVPSDEDNGDGKPKSVSPSAPSEKRFKIFLTICGLYFLVRSDLKSNMATKTDVQDLKKTVMRDYEDLTLSVSLSFFVVTLIMLFRTEKKPRKDDWKNRLRTRRFIISCSIIAYFTLARFFLLGSLELLPSYY